MTSNAEIPDQVAKAIIANRQHFHELNNQAKAANAKNSKVQFGFVTKPLALVEENQFWCIDDDEALDDFLIEDLLAALYGDENIDRGLMPGGHGGLCRARR